MNTNMVSKDYCIVRLDESKLPDLAFLHKAVYGNEKSLDYWKKKYDTKYTGVEYIGFVAYNNENIPVAYYGVLPCFIQEKDNIILAAQSGDTMTHPQYRYKGMFVELSNITFDLCKQQEIRLVFGFP